ncbi:unnamed protein product [Fraxinus pennsylvanica]|uniref:Retrotransposon Copia-like N-terminal domain-containing protein n=1 Tax=Fraxinus pennsylvanica TaxID=56036 RepID=A0AAD2DVX9_9LAMI|nr:unnamed protein product [Fraxinus pennsylvanica]
MQSEVHFVNGYYSTYHTLMIPAILHTSSTHDSSNPIAFLDPEIPLYRLTPMESSFEVTSEISSPYHLHPSDSPSLILISCNLTGDNFPKWQCTLRQALNAKNKLCFVDGTLNAPPTTSPDYAQWSRTKDMVLTWILNTITPFLSNSLDYHDDPQEQQRILHVSRTPSENVALTARSSHHDRPPFKCTEYGKDGHLRNRCWLIIGYPPGREPRNHRKLSLLGKPPSAIVHLTKSFSSPVPGLLLESYQQLMNLLKNPFPNPNFVGNSLSTLSFFDPQIDWIIDSGSTDHMSP